MTAAEFLAGRPTASEPAVAGDEAWSVYRHRDPEHGIIAELRTDGVPVGLALPPRLLELPAGELAAAVLRVLGDAAAGARELLEREAEEAEEFDPGFDEEFAPEFDTESDAGHIPHPAPDPGIDPLLRDGVLR